MGVAKPPLVSVPEYNPIYSIQEVAIGSMETPEHLDQILLDDFPTFLVKGDNKTVRPWSLFLRHLFDGEPENPKTKLTDC
jgi:hypothetical protein